MIWWKQNANEWVNLDQVVRVFFEADQGEPSQFLGSLQSGATGHKRGRAAKPGVIKSLTLYLSDGHSVRIEDTTSIQEVTGLLQIEAPTS